MDLSLCPFTCHPIPIPLFWHSSRSSPFFHRHLIERGVERVETKETRYAPLFLSVRAFSTTKNFLNKRNPFQLVERSPPLEIARVEDAPGDHANSMKESPVPFPTFRLFALVSFFFPPPFVLPLSLSSFFFLSFSTALFCSLRSVKWIGGFLLIFLVPVSSSCTNDGRIVRALFVSNGLKEIEIDSVRGSRGVRD